MGDYDYLDDMFANAYKQPEGRDDWGDQKEWNVNISLDQSKKKSLPKVKKDFLRKNSPPKRLQKPKKEVIKNDPQKFISHKKMTKKQMTELVRIYGSKDLGSGLYADFESKKAPATKKQSYTPSHELLKKSLTESSIPTPAVIPGELTYANSYAHLEKQSAPKPKKKKKGNRKIKKSRDPGYGVVGMQFDPLSATERHYHQQQNFTNMDKKNITFNEFNGELNDSAANIPTDGKKNTFQISSILKSTSKLSKNLNDSMQYSYLFSPKKTEDNPKAGMDFENENPDKNSLSLLERPEKRELTVKLSGGSDIHNFPEWTGLRDNYIQQLQNLNYHQDLVQNTDMVSDISIPNFIGLLLAIRKISFRIVDKYRQIILYNEKHENFKEMNSYIIKMATDVNCINRQPFVNWMGISPIFNTFFAERKIDGTTALFGDRAEKPKGLKFQGEFQNTRNDELREDLYKELYAKKPVYMRNELLMTTQEKHMVDELGGVIWNAYCTYQEAMHHRRAAAVIEGMTNLDHLENFDSDNITSVPDNNNNTADASFQSFANEDSILEAGGALENPSVIMNTASANYSVVSTFTSIRPMHIKNHMAVSWRRWRRLYLIRSGLRNLTEGRLYCTKRKVMDGWQKYSWQNMEFRRLQQRRWTQLLTFTFDGWFQYLHWCRKFNRVLQMANHENMRRVLKRMRIFSIYVHDNRNFKWKQFHMPLIITFRALKDNATINKFVMSKKLQRASQFTFGELNLRQFFFDKWRHFKNISMATETVDVALLVWGLRDALNEWKSLAWPRKYKSRRNLRVFKKGLFGRTTSTFMEGEEEEMEGEFIENKNAYVWPQQEKYGVAVTSVTPGRKMNPSFEEGEQDEEEEEEEEDAYDSRNHHALPPPSAQSQAQWQMAAFGAAGKGGGQGGSESGSEQSSQGGPQSTSSKKSWFSSLLSK